MSNGGEPEPDFFSQPSVAEKLAEARKESGFARAVRRIKKWCLLKTQR